MQKWPSAALESDTPTRRTQVVSNLRDRPSHPAFDRLEEMKVKELQEVSTRPLRGWASSHEIVIVQDHNTLKKGFNRLLDMHTESTEKITTLERDFNQCRELKAQLEARVERLEAQVIAANDANSMLRKVRKSLLPAYLLTYLPIGGFPDHLSVVSLPTNFPFQVFNEVSEKLKCMICLGLFTIPYRYGLLSPSTSFTLNQPVVLASTAATCVAGPAWSNGSLPREPQPALRVASTASTNLNATTPSATSSQWYTRLKEPLFRQPSPKISTP
jgi:hypothetical protein